MLAAGGGGGSGNLGSERSRILAIVGKFVTARMPLHVRMHPQCAITAEKL
jgi:hypothetical protein